MTVRERITIALERTGKSQRDLAKLMGLASASVSAMLSKDEIDSIKYLKAVESLTGYAFEWLRTGEGSEKIGLGIVQEDKTEYLTGKFVRPVAVTVDVHGKENMVLVPVRAFAGYMKGYADPHYIEKLNAYNLPNFSDGTYRMFQVDGNSMLQIGGGGLHDGDVVIAKYVEDIFTIRDNRVYVVVSKEGVVVKRVFNRLLTDDKVLILNSDNKSGDYPALILHPHEILEVWELKAYISRQLTFHTDLWQTLSKLESQQTIMQEKIKMLETKQINP